MADPFNFFGHERPHSPHTNTYIHTLDRDPTDTTGCAPHCRTRWLRGGLEMDVHVYTNGEEVELLLNGQSVGKRPVPVEPGTDVRCRRVEFSKVAYLPGTLEARAYRGGSLWATDSIATTTRTPAAIGLVVDWPLAKAQQAVLEADGSDVALIDVRILDADGRVIETPASHRAINFTLSSGSSGRILGVGNGDPSCHEPDAFPDTPTTAWRSAFHGHARVLLQSGTAEGALTLTATSPGLAPASIALAVRKDKVRDTHASASVESVEIAAAVGRE